MNTMENTIYPGDVISALGHSFTVWFIYFQDCFAGVYDVEFLDDQLRYHHWKQAYDGGSVVRSGVPGEYYADKSNRDRIGCIREARTPGTYTARIINRAGNEIYLGRYMTREGALARLADYGHANNMSWRGMQYPFQCLN